MSQQALVPPPGSWRHRHNNRALILSPCWTQQGGSFSRRPKHAVFRQPGKSRIINIDLKVSENSEKSSLAYSAAQLVTVYSHTTSQGLKVCSIISNSDTPATHCLYLWLSLVSPGAQAACRASESAQTRRIKTHACKCDKSVITERLTSWDGTQFIKRRTCLHYDKSLARFHFLLRTPNQRLRAEDTCSL